VIAVAAANSAVVLGLAVVKMVMAMPFMLGVPRRGEVQHAAGSRYVQLWHISS
jgi:hypothetical protein